MIDITHIHLENKLQLSPDRPQLYIIENPGEFYRVATQLRMQLDGAAGDFCFFEEGQPIDPTKYGEWLEPFLFDVNDKRLLNLLFKKAEQKYLQSRLYTQFAQLATAAECFVSDLSLEMPVELEYSALGFAELLKAMGTKIKMDYDGLLEKMVSYINALAQLKGLRFVVCINLKSVLCDEQLYQLYHHCQLEKISLLLLESTTIRPLLPQEHAIIITEDLCEIIANLS